MSGCTRRRHGLGSIVRRSSTCQCTQLTAGRGCDQSARGEADWAMMPTPEGTKTPKAIAVTLCRPWFLLQREEPAHRHARTDALSVEQFLSECEHHRVQTPQTFHAKEKGGSRWGAYLALMDDLASSACRTSIALSLERCSSASLCSCFTSSSMRSGYPCKATDA